MTYTTRPIQEKAFIFKVRSRMLDVKNTFKTSNSELLCRMCNIDEESQRHLLVCQSLSDSSIIASNSVVYEDILDIHVDKLAIIGRILIQKFKMFSNSTKCTDVFNVLSCAASKEELE